MLESGSQMLSLISWMLNWLQSKIERHFAGNQEDSIVYQLPYGCGESFQVIQEYGGAYSHTSEMFYSLDFGMPERTPVCAARGGIVYRVINHFHEGGTHASFKPESNVIEILHPDDTIAIYAHLAPQGNCVVGGDVVSAGQLIGYSGNTGWSGGPHLHFAVYDMIEQRGVPTRFATAELGMSRLKVNRFYTRPGQKRSANIEGSLTSCGQAELLQQRDPYAFSGELLGCVSELAEQLELAGFDEMSDYTSIEVMHDVHGLEVCGIPSASLALEIARLLLRHFHSWNAGWIQHPERESSQAYVARIQRDVDE